eukprot:scaffold27618_cov58-Phaeocystis_antarctica.AAC.2
MYLSRAPRRPTGDVGSRVPGVRARPRETMPNQWNAKVTAARSSAAVGNGARGYTYTVATGGGGDGGGVTGPDFLMLEA